MPEPEQIAPVPIEMHNSAPMEVPVTVPSPQAEMGPVAQEAPGAAKLRSTAKELFDDAKQRLSEAGQNGEMSPYEMSELAKQFASVDRLLNDAKQLDEERRALMAEGAIAVGPTPVRESHLGVVSTPQDVRMGGEMDPIQFGGRAA